MWEPSAVIPVAVGVYEVGLVRVDGDDVFLVRWNHARRCYAMRCNASAGWRFGSHVGTSWAVPTEAFAACAKRVQLTLPPRQQPMAVV